MLLIEYQSISIRQRYEYRLILNRNDAILQGNLEQVIDRVSSLQPQIRRELIDIQIYMLLAHCWIHFLSVLGNEWLGIIWVCPGVFYAASDATVYLLDNLVG